MSEQEPRVIGVVVCMPRADGSLPRHTIGGCDALQLTVQRMLRCRQLQQIIVLHPTNCQPQIDLPAGARYLAMDFSHASIPQRYHIARMWAPTAWRGGLGGATIYDEIIVPKPLYEVVSQNNADAAVLVGSDWPFVDPAICDALVERFACNPAGFEFTFTQAAPGLAGCLISTRLLGEMASTHAMIGSVLDYQPMRPQADPIGRDGCVRIAASVAQSSHRFTCDPPRYADLLAHIAANLGSEKLSSADAELVVELAKGFQSQRMPQQYSIEINTQRNVNGPIVPQHHLPIDRESMTLDMAKGLFAQIACEPDAVLTLGGLGDPLLHPQFGSIVEAASEAGIGGIHIETDLLLEQGELADLIALPIDVFSVRLNADTDATYAQLMGADCLRQVWRNIEWILNHRREARRGGLWVVPRMIKTAENVGEIENFVDRWVQHCGQAVVEPPLHGAGKIADSGVLQMAPPVRKPCRQLWTRMMIHSDGRVARCDQDWLPEDDGRATGDSLRSQWDALQAIRSRHEAGRYDECGLCAHCDQWHRP